MRDLRTQSAVAFGLTAQRGMSVTMLNPLLNQAKNGYAVGGAAKESVVLELPERKLEEQGADFNVAFCSFYIEAMRISVAEDDLDYGIGSYLDEQNDIIIFDVVDIVDDLEVALDVAKTREQLHIFNLETQEVLLLNDE